MLFVFALQFGHSSFLAKYIVLQYGHSILIISLKCLSMISIFFSFSFNLCFALEVENENQKAAIVITRNIIEKINIIWVAIVPDILNPPGENPSSTKSIMLCYFRKTFGSNRT